MAWEGGSRRVFELGGLKKVSQIFDLQKYTLSGLDEEKEKYEKLIDLSNRLCLLDVRNNYPKTFQGMYFIPLAIQNNSAIQDENIRVVIDVDIGIIVDPDEHLIWDDYEGLQGLICRHDKDDAGLICELFCLEEDGVIRVADPPDNPSEFIPKVPVLAGTGFFQQRKTKEDYKQELEDFIASSFGRGYYEFEIMRLCPNECKRLCCGLLIKPVDNTIAIRYHVYSTHSTGELNGSLELQVTESSE